MKIEDIVYVLIEFEYYILSAIYIVVFSLGFIAGNQR